MDIDHLNPPQDRFDPVRFAAVARGDGDGLRGRPLQRKDGRVVWVELAGQVVRDAQGRALCVQAVVLDVSARRRHLQALREREARLAFLVRLSDALRQLAEAPAIAFEASCLLGEFVGADRVGYAEDGGDGQSVTVARNYTAGVPGIEGRYRYADYGEDLVQALRAGRTVVRSDIANDPSLSAHEKASHAVLQLGATVNVPVIKGGRLEAILFIHSRAARDWSAEEVGLFEDVAERLRADLERAHAETAQRAIAAQLETALASMNDAVFITDLEGRFVQTNDAFVSFHRRRSKAECPSTPAQWARLLDVSHVDGMPLALSQWAVPRALRGESGQHLEFRLRRKDTGESWVGSYSFAPIRDSAGAVTGAVITARDVTPFKRLQAELAAAHDGLQRLVTAQDRALEDERLRIARELHDDMQQSLVAMLMEVGTARAAIAATDASVTGADEALARIGALSRQAIAATRRIIRDLRPQALEELGLEAALKALTAQFAAHSGLACRIDTRGLDRANPRHLAAIGTCVYRVTQEALNNIAKHAGARSVRIALHRLRDGRLRLAVADDGRGLAAGARERRDAFGLLGMHERLRAVGGTLDVRSRPGRGTTVEATLPEPAGTADRQARLAPSGRRKRSTPAQPEAARATATATAAATAVGTATTTATAAPATPS
jgi:signal transduction histidine kinase